MKGLKHEDQMLEDRVILRNPFYSLYLLHVIELAVIDNWLYFSDACEDLVCHHKHNLQSLPPGLSLTCSIGR